MERHLVHQVKKYGQIVWSHVRMDHDRQTECLCLNCAVLLKCQIADRGHKFCQEFGVAYAMTRCPFFQLEVGEGRWWDGVSNG